MSNLEGSERTTWLCIYVPSSLSLAASVWMLSTYYIFPKLQTPTIRLVMLKTVVQVIYALVYGVAFYNVPSSDTLACRLQGWGITFSVNCSVLLTAAMAGYMVLTIEKKQRITLTHTILAIISVVVAVISSILASIPLLFDQYANVGARCWIAEDEDGRDRQTGSILRFTVYYDVIWACIVFIVVCYYKVTRYLRLTNSFKTTLVSRTNKTRGASSSAEEVGADDQDPKKTPLVNSHATFVHRTISLLLMYPVICIFAWTPITLLRIIDAVDPSYVPSEAFLGFSMVAARSQGVFFGIVFWNYRAVNKEWKRVFKNIYLIVLTSLCPVAPPRQISSNATASSDTGGAAPVVVAAQRETKLNKETVLLISADDGMKPKVQSDAVEEKATVDVRINGSSIDGTYTRGSMNIMAAFRRTFFGDSFAWGNQEHLIPAHKNSSTSTQLVIDPAFEITDGIDDSDPSAVTRASGNFASSRVRLSDTISHLTSMMDMEMPEDVDNPESPFATPWGTSTRHIDMLNGECGPDRHSSFCENNPQTSVDGVEIPRLSVFI